MEFCVNNLSDEMKMLKDELEQDPTLDVVEYGCLGNCGVCAERCFVFVDGESIEADNAVALREKIKKARAESVDPYDVDFDLDRLP
ncbi:DUF1450 domain-containing protein [Mechercharimyces sp. CAU 1602]|uniref:DUF1450 domain-containing protein n=1 Tax=Mechercharimyces sp. CAU 1602 TaxID=2973933 RepID=UPI0021620A86|nr:DUF1450 domain-containing protein [Mechercharimyces sp. CAU 1602]